MKRLLLQAAVITIAISAYIAAPFVTAWSIREAVRNGDSAYLENAIDWPGVRETLKPTLSRIALGMPDPEVQPNATPGLWQRFKAYMGEGAINRTIDGYITPEGLPKLFAARKAYREYVSHEPDEAKTLPITERIKRAWSRVKRAEFTSLTSFEVDMADKWDANRIYLGKLELTGLGWQLKELRVKFLTTAENAASKFVETGRAVGRGIAGTGFISAAEAAPLSDTYQSAIAQPKTGFLARAKNAARLAWRGDR